MESLQKLSVLKGEQLCFSPRKIHRMFEEQADKGFGEKIALIFRDENEIARQTSYNMLNSSANRIASALLDIVKSKRLEVSGDGDWVIAVYMKPSDDLVTTLLAIWKCGGKTNK